MNEPPDDSVTQPTPFDERGALEEIEQARQGIERYQARRQEVIDEFERFLKSFKRPEPPATAVVPAPPAPALIEPPQVVPPVAVPIAQPIDQPIVEPIAHMPPPETAPAWTPEEAPDSMNLPPGPEPGVVIAASPPPRQSRTTTWLVVGGVLAMLSVGGYAWTTRGGRNVTSNSPQPAPAKAPAPAPAPPAPSATARAAPAPSPYDSVLVTTDPAWVRVVADGEKIVERELAADTRIPIKAEKTIQIRTGNAGAVKLIIGGVDRGPLGREGEVITRTFTVSR